MTAVESSLAWRGVRVALLWLGRTGRYSATGRLLVYLASGLGRAVGASRTLGTGRIACSPVDDQSGPVSVTALVRSVLALRGVLADGSLGRWLRASATALPCAQFGRGEWIRLVGAGLLGLGGGLFSLHLATAIVVVLAGALLALAGPLLAAGFAQSDIAGSVLSRSAGPAGPTSGGGTAAALVPSPGGRPVSGARAAGLRIRPSLTVGAGMLLCAAAGAAAGVAPSNRAAVVALAVALGVVVLVLRHPEAILLVIAAFPWVDWVARRSLGAFGPLWDDALLLVSIGLLLWSVLVLRKGTFRGVPIALPVLLAVAAALGSIVVRRVPTDVGFYALRVLFEPILFYFVGFLFPKSVRWVRGTIAVFLLASSTLALHGLYQYATHAPMPPGWVDVAETGIAVRAYSVVQNPNVLGAVLAMGALLSGSLALSRALCGIRRAAVSVACVVQLAGLAVTFSRGAWLGFVVGLLAAMVLACRRYLVAAIGAGVVAWFAAPRVFIDRLLFAFSTTYVGRSAESGRLFRWDAALQHIRDHPFLGAGLGTFGGTAAYMFGYWALWVDNFYLQMAAEGGLLLLVFFLWLLTRGAKALVRAHRVAGEPYLAALTAGMLGAFVAVAVADLFEGDWETLAVGVGYWFLAGLLTAAALEAGTRRDGEEVA